MFLEQGDPVPWKIHTKDKPPAASSLHNASHFRLPRPQKNALKLSSLHVSVSME